MILGGKLIVGRVHKSFFLNFEPRFMVEERVKQLPTVKWGMQKR